MTTHYDTLGVPPDASADDIKGAFRRKAQQVHPDRGGSDEEMAKVNRAYAVLADPQARQRYDETGTDGPDAPSLEQEAQQGLREVLTKAIERNPANIVREATGLAASNRTVLSRTLEGVRTNLARLEKQRGRVRSKGARNIAEEIIAAGIASSEEHQKRLEYCLEIQTRIEHLLTEYEQDDPPAATSMNSMFGYSGSPFWTSAREE